MMVTIPHAINYYADLYQIPNLRDHFKKYNTAEAGQPVRIFPGIPEVLKRVREIGADNYIFTNRGDSIYHLL